jgi:hypothetical protein
MVNETNVRALGAGERVGRYRVISGLWLILLLLSAPVLGGGQIELPLAGNAVDFNALFDPVKDPFETKDEFSARKKQLLPAYNQAASARKCRRVWRDFPKKITT